MVRSFTDRVFAGICGGLGALTGRSAWWFRLVFIVLSLVTGGAFAALYVLLWWLLPQESLTGRQRRSPALLLLVALLALATLAGWWLNLNGELRSAAGQDLLWPLLLLALAVVFFLRQVRA
jgi:phage shock protein C